MPVPTAPDPGPPPPWGVGLLETALKTRDEKPLWRYFAGLGEKVPEELVPEVTALAQFVLETMRQVWGLRARAETARIRMEEALGAMSNAYDRAQVAGELIRNVSLGIPGPQPPPDSKEDFESVT